MDGILIRNLVRTYGPVKALDGLDLEIAAGELFVILGPSGCGKTTLLRCVAGVDDADTGSIELKGRTVFQAGVVSVPPKERGVGMVFQNYALYPHMTVEKNVAFGLRLRKVSKVDTQRRVSEALELVGLTGFEKRRPATLSGGQRQRVAIARSIVTRPQVLLFDEPLSNLDPKLRVGLRDALVRILREVGITALYVTHDQSEAMVMADRIAVMDQGRVEQVGSARDIYEQPQTVGIASFIAQPKTNIISGDIRRDDDEFLFVPDADPYGIISLPGDLSEFAGRGVILNVRPEDVELLEDPGDNIGHFTVAAAQWGFTTQAIHVMVGRNLLLAHRRTAAAGGSVVGLRFQRGTIYNPLDERIIGAFSDHVRVA